MQKLLRVRLLTLSVISPPAASLAVTGKTFVRTIGSFLDDRFAPGMEIIGAGMDDPANELPAIVTAVTISVLSVNRILVAESDGPGKSFTAGLPSRRSWENDVFTPDQGFPFVEEEYLPGPTEQITLGPGGLIEAEPMYVVRVHVPENTGPEAANLYGDALVSLFAPRTAISLDNGDVLRVRASPGPFRTQLLELKPGWATVPVTIPLRIRTTNP